MQVVWTLTIIGCREEVVIAGLLHDVVEDTAVTSAEIEQKFGHTVAELVRINSEPDKTAPWEVRKQHTLDTLTTAPLEAVMIAFADKLDNLRSIKDAVRIEGSALWARFNRPRSEQARYYRSLLVRFQDRLANTPAAPLLEDFASLVHEIFMIDSSPS
jgi:(p)ppGpp synthase/HD superfamily hydrolase